MKIYELDNDAENYRWLEYEGNWFHYFHNLLDSKPIEPTKETIYCHSIRDKKERVFGDYPCFTVPAISEKAKGYLLPFWGDAVQMFPLVTRKNGMFYYLNVINILDCMDEDKAEIKYLNPNKFMRIIKYVFKNNYDAKALRVFKIRKDERGPIYVSEETKKLIEDAKLEGFEFVEVGEIDTN